MPKFIVFSVDHEQQQAFVDFTQAATTEAALATVLKYRDYCCHGMVYTPDELRDLADRCEKEPMDFFEEVP